MRMKPMSIFTWSLLAITVCACSSGNGESNEEIVPTTPQTSKMAIKINSTVSAPDVRATDDAFEAGDKVGLFVVNRNADGSANALQAQGNHADNVAFTYNGTWTSASAIYWKDAYTHADFYLYYPYASSVSSVDAMPFSVNADQSSEAAYKAGDLMVGSTANVAPTENAVNIGVKHVMSQMLIKLVAGNGFTDETLAAASVGVSINGVKTNATVNLATADVTATGDAVSVTPLNTDGSYKALIVPQTVDEGNLITVNVDGRDFNLNKGFTFVGGKRHQFSVKLSKTSNGINVNITGWDDDGVDNGGTAE